MVINPERHEQPLRGRAVEGVGRLHGLAAPVAEEETATHPELVALRVATEIVVIVEDQDRVVRTTISVEVRSGEPAHPGAHDNEFARLFDRKIADLEALAVADPVRDVERARVAAPHPGSRRRVAGVAHAPPPRTTRNLTVAITRGRNGP